MVFAAYEFTEADMAEKSMMSNIAKRSFLVFCIFILIWVYLTGVLFKMQVLDYESYQNKVIEQLTVETKVNASRGNIYDANMNLLATSKTAWRVFISPVDIQSAKYSSAAQNIFYRMRYGMSKDTAAIGMAQDELIAKGLSKILGVDYDIIMKKAAMKGRRDETIKTNVDKKTADSVLEFVEQNKLSNQVHVIATTVRYYSYDNLASHIIGFTGTDGQGLYGLELKYDKELTGTPGRYITAKDGIGGNMPFEYQSYIEAEDGYGLVTTIDMRIQYELELQLEATLIDSGAQNRVCGIVMDVNTGAILAMAAKPDFNLNSPYTLNPFLTEKLLLSDFDDESDEYKDLRREFMLQMWNNKPVTEMYEPGSTFKVMTVAMALEEKKVSLTDTFFCPGYHYVEGYSKPIRCHKAGGHGSLDLVGGLQQSCNPVLMTLGARIGRDLFYKYFDAFGYLNKTGIDLPGEGTSYFHSKSALNPVELATASFGQRFKVTPLQQIAAVGAVANGGSLVTPHLLKALVDSDGKVVKSYEPQIKRQVVSEETCRTITQILADGVSGDGGAKNAYVKGYRVAAKTGTSEKFDVLNEAGQSYLRIGSCVAYAPADDPQVAILIMVDEPTCVNIYGSVVAAPYVSNTLGVILPYLGVEPQYTEEELKSLAVNIGSYVGIEVSTAKSAISSLGIKYEVVGTGETVTSQIPQGGSSLSKDTGKIILYTGNEMPKNTVTVPNVEGKSAATANRMLINAGLNIKIQGAQNYTNGEGAFVISQSPAAGEAVTRGSIVTVEFRHLDGTD